MAGEDWVWQPDGKLVDYIVETPMPSGPSFKRRRMPGEALPEGHRPLTTKTIWAYGPSGRLEEHQPYEFSRYSRYRAHEFRVLEGKALEDALKNKTPIKVLTPSALEEENARLKAALEELQGARPELVKAGK